MFILKTILVCQSQIIIFSASFDLIKFELFSCTYNLFSGDEKKKLHVNPCQFLYDKKPKFIFEPIYTFNIII